MADLMNPGGGLTKSKLLLANAVPSDVSQEKGFYSRTIEKLELLLNNNNPTVEFYKSLI